MDDQRLQEILSFDPLSQAERISGNSYNEDENTMMMGFMMDLMHGQNKETILQSLDDTTLSNDLDNYIRIIKSEGFEEVLILQFIGTYTKKCERMFVYFQKEKGILLKFDTYNQNHVNSGNYYYNWKPNDTKEAWGMTSSGGYEKDVNGDLVWVGNHDCREALRFHIRQLSNNGQFVTPWLKQPFLWLLHYEDTKEKDYDYNTINKKRIGMLPDFVQEAIKGI